VRYFFVLLLTTLLTLPARAATTVDLIYDITMLGFNIGSVHYRIVQAGDAYTLTFDGGFGGLAGMFADASGKATTVGVIRNNKVLPSRMDQVTHWGEKERNVYVVFDNAGNIASHGATPPYSPEGRVPVAPDMLKNVLDTQSSLLHMLPADGSAFCNKTVRVFDGRERYDLQFSPAGKAEADLKCRVTPVQLGGHKVNGTKPRAFTMSFQVIEMEGRKLAIPAKTVKPFAVGEAIIRLRRIDVRGQETGDR